MSHLFDFYRTTLDSRAYFGRFPRTPDTTDSKDKGTDCTRFADSVNKLAEASSTDTTFVASLFGARNDTPGLTGFKPEFTDREGGSPNQARHTAGAISFGYSGGVAASGASAQTQAAALVTTVVAFNLREKEFVNENLGSNTRHSNQVDINLNAVAVPVGFSLGIGAISRERIGDLIRSLICDN